MLIAEITSNFCLSVFMDRSFNVVGLVFESPLEHAFDFLAHAGLAELLIDAVNVTHRNLAQFRLPERHHIIHMDSTHFQ